MIEELVNFQNKLASGELPVKPGQHEIYSEAASNTDEGRQGDLYFRTIDKIPSGYVNHVPFIKMVPGDTIGAKHCFNKLPLECWIPEGWNSREYEGLLGPVVKLNGHVLQHQEHGHITFGDCLIQFGYQKSLEQEELIARRKD